MAKKISVLMGIYNCASTLAESIESLLNQTYKDFELVLCDDGSSDETYQEAKKYADQYDNIILLRNETNRGLNYTLNRCAQVASGEYFARQDGDDLSLPERFEKEVAILAKHPEISLVSSAMTHFDEQGDFKIKRNPEYPQPKDFVSGPPFCHAPCMIRREAFHVVGGYSESERLLRVEDYHLWFKLYAAGFKGYNIPDSLYKMRDDRNAFSRRTWKNRMNEVYVRYLGYRMLKLPVWNYFCIVKPIVVGLLPFSVYKYLHSRS